MPHHMTGAYDGFDTLQEALHHFRRCRSRKNFILSEQGVKQENPICAVCGNRLLDDPKNHHNLSNGYRGNRCFYNPKTNNFVCMHYICSWENILQKI
jgi:hypothetical protein